LFSCPHCVLFPNFQILVHQNTYTYLYFASSHWGRIVRTCCFARLSELKPRWAKLPGGVATPRIRFGKVKSNKFDKSNKSIHTRWGMYNTWIKLGAWISGRPWLFHWFKVGANRYIRCGASSVVLATINPVPRPLMVFKSHTYILSHSHFHSLNFQNNPTPSNDLWWHKNEIYPRRLHLYPIRAVGRLDNHAPSVLLIHNRVRVRTTGSP